LRITNTSSTNVARLAISCQRGAASPQIVGFTLQPNTSADYKTDGDCLLAACP